MITVTMITVNMITVNMITLTVVLITVSIISVTMRTITMIKVTLVAFLMITVSMITVSATYDNFNHDRICHDHSNHDQPSSPGFYAGQFNQGIRDGHGVRVFHPNSKLKDAFANKTLTDSSSEVPSATDLERLLGDKIFCEFEEGDVSIIL